MNTTDENGDNPTGCARIMLICIAVESLLAATIIWVL